MTEKHFTEEQLFADLKKDGINLDASIIKNAQKGNGEALWSIGYEYDIEQKQYDKAMAWYRLGANRNHAHALNNIGMLYHNGQGVTKNYLDALEWWIKSAKQNNILSLLNIGNLFNNGQGVPLDTMKAQQWYHINDASVDKEIMMKRLIKETENILNTERNKILTQSNHHLSKPSQQENNNNNDNNSNNTDPPEEEHKYKYDKECLPYKQQVDSLKITNQTIEQEMNELKQSNQSLRERLRSKESNIKTLKDEIKAIYTQQDIKETRRLYKRLVRSQRNEIKLIKENAKLLLKREKRSKRKLKKELEEYKERLH